MRACCTRAATTTLRPPSQPEPRTRPPVLPARESASPVQEPVLLVRESLPAHHSVLLVRESLPAPHSDGNPFPRVPPPARRARTPLPLGRGQLPTPRPRGKPLPQAITLALFFLGLSLPSCSDHTKRAWKHQSQADNFRIALEGENADDRRDAVARIAESGYVAADDAFSVLDAVARTDSVAQIRCIAIRAFTRYDDPRPVGTLLAVLAATPDAHDKALPPNDDVRWEAASVLSDLDARGQLNGPDRDTARALFIKLADRTSTRSVRIVALRALGSFQDRDVFGPLMLALHEEDFALADTAERSLIALTGTSHNYDPDAWEKWLAATPDPFARAGQQPATTRPMTPTRWDKEKRKWQRMFEFQRKN